MARKILRYFVNTVLALVIIFIGVRVSKYLVSTKPPAKLKPATMAGTLVEVAQLEESVHQVTVQARGTVIPAREVQLRPQVSGRVLRVHPQLVPGGRIAADEPLIELDRADYRLAVDERKTAVAQAQAQLRVEKGREEVAAKEWELFESTVSDTLGPSSPENRELALRGPQIASARSNIDAAKSRLDRARLDLARTEVRAPFNAMVRQESVEVGEVVTPQNVLATLVGTDMFWVQLSMPIDRLEWLDIPGVNSEVGSPAVILQSTGTGVVRRTGKVERLLGELDPIGRMARLLVAVEDPLGGSEPGGLPLLLGAFVNVELAGSRTVTGVAIPRGALRDGNSVYVMNHEDKLEIRALEIGWRTRDEVIAVGGVLAGERLVTTKLPTPLEGMLLRLHEAGEDVAVDHAPREDAHTTSKADDAHDTSQADAAHGTSVAGGGAATTKAEAIISTKASDAEVRRD